MELLIGLLFIAAVGALASLGGKKPEEKKPDETIEIKRYGGKKIEGSVKFLANSIKPMNELRTWLRLPHEL